MGPRRLRGESGRHVDRKAPVPEGVHDDVEVLVVPVIGAHSPRAVDPIPRLRRDDIRAGLKGYSRLRDNGTGEPIREPPGIDGALGDAEPRDDLVARHGGQFAGTEFGDVGAGEAAHEVLLGVGVLADELTDRCELRSQIVWLDHRPAVHQVDVVLGRGVTGQTAADEFPRVRCEEETAGQHVPRRRQARIRPVEVSEMDLALIPATRRRHRLGLAVDDGHIESAASQVDRHGAAHDAGTQYRDPTPAHDGTAGATVSTRTNPPRRSFDAPVDGSSDSSSDVSGTGAMYSSANLARTDLSDTAGGPIGPPVNEVNHLDPG